MKEFIPTLTLQIGDLDKGDYPIRLYKYGEKEPIAEARIPKISFDRGDWQPDPITKFLEEPEASADFKTIGAKLYSLIHIDDVAEKWDKFVEENAYNRLQLEIIPAEIASFPWELVYRKNVSWLAASNKQTIIRYYENKGAKKAIPDDSLPLRVLIVIGSPDDDEAVSPLDEVRQIEAKLYDYDRDNAENKLSHRMIDIEVLKRPDLTKLEDVYKKIQPHIFHFIGHGGENKDGDVYLGVNYPVKKEGTVDEYGLKEFEWTYDLIQTNFNAWGRLPQLVLINACRSEKKGTTHEELRGQAWSIGDVFRNLGVPAVLTMQADINGKSAGIFGAALYKALARLEPLDIALANARNAMLNVAQSTKKRDWAIPVLSVALLPEEIFSFKLPPSDLTKIKNCVEFREIAAFSDRTEPRRQLFHGLYPLPSTITDHNLVIVNGKTGAGKTWLVKWFLEVCALLGNDVRYVEVGGDKGKTWLDVLLQIRHGDDVKQHSSLIYEPLNESAFSQFYWELENRYRATEPPLWEGQPVTVKDDYKLADPNANWSPSFHVETVPSFKQSIVQAAEINKPLIIVLDHFPDNLEDDMKKQLIPGLIRPAALGELTRSVDEGQVRTVKLIVVLTPEQFRNFDIEMLTGGARCDVPVEYLDWTTFADVATEYLRKFSAYERLNFEEDKIKKAVEGVAALLPEKEPYPPSVLKSYDYLKKL
jgi:hypothetical protein